MKRFLKKVFLPNEFDGVVLAIGLCIVSAIAFAICQYGFDTSYYGLSSSFFFKFLSIEFLFGSLMAIGTIVADHKRRVQIRVVLGTGVAVSLALYILFSRILGFWCSQDWESLAGIESFDSISSFSNSSLLQIADWWVVLGIACLVITSILGTICTQYATKFAKYLKRRLNVNRLKFLCAFAVGIGILAMAQNLVLVSRDNNYGWAIDFLFEKASWLFFIPVEVLAILFGVAIPGYVFNCMRPGWVRGLVACGYFLIIFLTFQIVVGSPFENCTFLDVLILPMGYWFSFCLTHHLVAFRKLDAFQETSVGSASAKVKKITVWPGKWSLATCILVAAGMFTIFRYDPCVLFEDLPRLNWDGARVSRLVKRNLECDIFVTSFSEKQSGSRLGVKVKLNADSPSKVLWPVDRKNIDTLFISNNQSHIDFRFLKNLDSVDLRLGQLSQSQLQFLKRNDTPLEAYDVLLSDAHKMNSRIVLYTLNGTNLYQVFFEDDVKSNVLELCTWPPVKHLLVSNSRCQIDYGMLDGVKIATIEGGEITAEQIKDLGYSIEDLQLNDVQMIRSDLNEKIVFNGKRLTVHHEQSSSFLFDFLQAVDFENSEFELHIDTSCEFSEEIMEQLPRIPKEVQVEICFGDFQGDVSLAWKQVMRLLLFSHCVFDASGIEDDDQNYSRALMVAGPQFDLSSFLGYPFLGSLDENPQWIYSGKSETKEKLKVFVPVSIPEFVQQLSENESKIAALGMDPSWCGFQTTWINDLRRLHGVNVITLGEALAAFPGIREIYLTSEHRFRSLDFLKPLKSLEKLQIDFSQVESKNSSGIMSMPPCPSIKELTLLAAPKKSIVDGIKISVPNLERLVIVDSNQEYRSFLQEKKRLEKELPGVVVEIYDPTQIDKLVPQEFKDHIEKLRQEIRDSMQRRNVDSDNGSEKPLGKR